MLPARLFAEMNLVLFVQRVSGGEVELIEFFSPPPVNLQFHYECGGVISQRFGKVSEQISKNMEFKKSCYELRRTNQ